MVERKLFNHPYFHFSLCSQIICDQICLDWQFVTSIVTFGHFLHDWSIIEDNANWKKYSIHQMCPDCEQWWWQWRQRLWYLDRVRWRGENFHLLSKFWIFPFKLCLLVARSNIAHLHLKSYPEGCGRQVREGEGVHKMETSKKQAHPSKTSSEFKTSIARLICILNLVYTKWKPPKNKLTQVNETWCHHLMNLSEY